MAEHLQAGLPSKLARIEMKPMVVCAELLDRSRIAHWAPLPLRLIVGYGFIAHGYAKLMKGPDAFVAISTIR